MAKTIYPTMLLSLVGVLNTLPASAQIEQGFNYGATNSDGSCRDYNAFSSFFTTAKSLPNAPSGGFHSARLYTMIQCGTTSTPISAIPAALDSDTSLLLGLWGSAGQENFNNELGALSAAIGEFGQRFADKVVGISVGSEDLYRSSAQGMANNAGIGASAATVASYVGQVRDAIKNTVLADKPVGHVDTWTAWILPENAPVVAAVDWLGHNSFPYFENTLPNSIGQGEMVFNNALGNTERVAAGKPVWVTETGWPVSGPSSNEAVASVDNARTYWSQVGCELFGSRSTWWYTLTDANTAQTEISFGIVQGSSTTPVYDLSC